MIVAIAARVFLGVKSSLTLCFDERENAAQMYEIGDLQYKGDESGVLDTEEEVFRTMKEKRERKVQGDRRNRSIRLHCLTID